MKHVSLHLSDLLKLKIKAFFSEAEQQIDSEFDSGGKENLESDGSTMNSNHKKWKLKFNKYDVLFLQDENKARRLSLA